MRWSIDDVPIFVAVAGQLSITAAANELGISKSTVSKALTRLEEGLGVRLLERNSRNVRVTSEGEVFLHHAVSIMEQVSEADVVMSGLTSEPYGKLVVALPVAFAREFVAPRLEMFRRQCPQVEIELMITSHPVDVVRDRVDLAVVIGALGDSELVARPLYESSLVWVTTPEYRDSHNLHGGLDELVQHIHICEKRYGLPGFPVRIGSKKQQVNLSRGIIQVNDPIAVREAVLNGCGVSVLPDQYCKKHILDGRLVRVYQEVGVDASAAKLSVVYPSRRFLSNKTRAFIDFLLHVCRDL